jgi:hypothetical protein
MAQKAAYSDQEARCRTWGPNTVFPFAPHLHISHAFGAFAWATFCMLLGMALSIHFEPVFSPQKATNSLAQFRNFFARLTNYPTVNTSKAKINRIN